MPLGQVWVHFAASVVEPCSLKPIGELTSTVSKRPSIRYYPRMANPLTDLISEFAPRLTVLVQAQAVERARASVNAALGMSTPKRGPGRPPKASTAVSPVAKKARKKPPRQLCPVPGCKNTAAPIFGMVSAKPKGVKKSLIKKYREARKAKKLKAAA